jgi:hypothetical protein
MKEAFLMCCFCTFVNYQIVEIAGFVVSASESYVICLVDGLLEVDSTLLMYMAYLTTLPSDSIFVSATGVSQVRQ